jgi:HEAT repeat protein
MQETLKTAIAQKNWLLVEPYLQGRLSEIETSDRQQIVELALQMLEEGDFQQRWEIAKILPKLGTVAIAPLIEILEDEEANLETRWFVGRILSEFNHPSSIIALANLLERAEDEELSSMASQALANLGISAIVALSELLEQPETRLLAVQALAQIRHSEIVTPLLTVVNDPSAKIRTVAIEALSSFYDEPILPVLLNGLQDTASAVRKEAAIALGLRPQERAKFNLVKRLQPLLFDLNLEVAQQAAIALGRLGGDDAARALFPVLKSPATPVWLKLTLVRALGWIETHQSLDYLREGLFWEETEVCQEIVTVLGRLELPPIRQKATQFS